MATGPFACVSPFGLLGKRTPSSLELKKFCKWHLHLILALEEQPDG